MAIYLNVTFRDKEIVKGLGARWDGARRQWFVPEGVPSTRFARWIAPDLGSAAGGAGSSEAASALIAPPSAPAFGLGPQSAPAPGASPQGATLSTVLFEAAEAVRRALPQPRWIIAEIASFRSSPGSGHYYAELVEHDESGREVAKASGRIWSSSARIVKKFEKQAGGPLAPGMKILFLGQADFSIQYGFGLTIQDIDPAWTLGEMQRKVMEIRSRLQQEGLYERNKKLPRPHDFTRVAVVAPELAAGLGDFMADAKLIQEAGLCHFDYYGAVFEGGGALPALLRAFSAARAEHEKAPYDALVVIRGGGASTSLNWLNEYELAKAICEMPMPALTGIGHERDDTILDELARERFDTPSKVAAGIFSRIAQNAARAQEAYDRVTSGARQTCLQVQSQVELAWAGVERSARESAALAESLARRELTSVFEQARQITAAAREQTDSLGREVVGLGPASVLGRGYAVVKANGRPLAKAAGAVEGQAVEIVFADGGLTATVSAVKHDKEI